MWANRNAFFYTLDRETGEFLLGTPFAKQTWALDLDSNGRADVIIAKQRHGPTGTVNLRFYPEATKFDNLEDEDDLDGPGRTGGFNRPSGPGVPATGEDVPF